MSFGDSKLSDSPPSPSTEAPDFTALYGGKNVLVLGGSGFMGFNLTRKLADCGANVAVGSRGQTVPAGPYPPNVEWFRTDLTNISTLQPAIRDRDIIFIVTGATGAVNSINAPIEDLYSNLSGQLNLLESLRSLPKCPRLVLAGTRLVYGVAQHLPVNETHPTNPTSAYGVHKLTAEKYHLLYHHLHQMPTTVTRITVVYGPNTPANSTDYGVVSRFAHNLILGKPITLYGEGAQTRDFVYIDDVVDALLRLGACDRAIGRAFNIGNSRPITLLNLAQTLVRVAGHGELRHVPWPADAQKVETGNFYADVSLMRHVTGWRPRTSLEEGLRNVLQFMRRRQQPEQAAIPVNV